jgi:hypothetical protein
MTPSRQSVWLLCGFVIGWLNGLLWARVKPTLEGLELIPTEVRRAAGLRPFDYEHWRANR